MPTSTPVPTWSPPIRSAPFHGSSTNTVSATAPTSFPKPEHNGSKRSANSSAHPITRATCSAPSDRGRNSPHSGICIMTRCSKATPNAPRGSSTAAATFSCSKPVRILCRSKPPCTPAKRRTPRAVPTCRSWFRAPSNSPAPCSSAPTPRHSPSSWNRSTFFRWVSTAVPVRNSTPNTSKR